LFLNEEESKANELGVPMIIAIVDESGKLKAFSRMDGTPLLSLDLAIDKAWSGASFPVPTHSWYDIIKDDAALFISVPLIKGLTTSGGGYPLIINGVTVGGIGVSGGTVQQDMECAEAGLAVFDQSKE
jgi:uncharacterized protein GlcG (DUF336 family)